MRAGPHRSSGRILHSHTVNELAANTFRADTVALIPSFLVSGFRDRMMRSDDRTRHNLLASRRPK